MSGTPRPRIEAGQTSAGRIAPATLAEARESFLFVDPVWLAGTDAALPGMTPFHTVARRRDDEHAVLPGYLVTEPALPDVDPLTYLRTGPAEPGRGTGGDEPVDGITSADLLPALVLGSPLGFHTEPFFTFWTERLLGDLVDATVAAARAAGARSVVAPWISSRLTGVDLGAALRAAGAETAFWGTDEHIPLTAASPAAHLTGMTRKHRRRIREDVRRLDGNAELRSFRGAEITEVADALCELVAETYRRNGTPLRAEWLRTACDGLLTTTDSHAVCAFDPNGRLLGGHILFHKRPRLYAKWIGTTADAAGSGVYFALVVEAAVELGYRLGATSLELGAGANEAKRLRGSLSRTKTTALLALDPAVQAACAPQLRRFGAARSGTTNDGPVELPLVAAGTTDSACCSD